jgi:DnaK suppressor protein
MMSPSQGARKRAPRTSRSKDPEEAVTSTHTKPDKAYVEKKRQQLLKLRDELIRTTNSAEGEESGIKSAASSQAREYEDDAQKLDLLDKEDTLVGHAVTRLALVERALAKIADGTYGFSDVSGHRIPNERLDILPEAINTVAEEKAAEGTR